MSYISNTLLIGFLVIGMGLSSMANYEMRRRRLWERLRVAFFSWLYDSEDDDEQEKLAEKFRKPVDIEDIEGTPMKSSTISTDNETDEACGIRRELVSPDWAHTSKLGVTVLTLFSGAELVAKKAEGVEFYYVIQGGGLYFKGEDAIKITSGTCFVVDPGW
jgi:mannose-6-phosphate isomerase-like protein (cupin superfamily)